MRNHCLIDCDPKWSDDRRRVRFTCPEGHADCWHSIPFTPTLDGEPQTSQGAQWDRVGDSFGTLTLSPSIRRVPQYPSREAALADGCLPEYVTEASLCALHVNLDNGWFTFADDSR